MGAGGSDVQKAALYVIALRLPEALEERLEIRDDHVLSSFERGRPRSIPLAHQRLHDRLQHRNGFVRLAAKGFGAQAFGMFVLPGVDVVGVGVGGVVGVDVQVQSQISVGVGVFDLRVGLEPGAERLEDGFAANELEERGLVQLRPQLGRRRLLQRLLFRQQRRLSLCGMPVISKEISKYEKKEENAIAMNTCGLSENVEIRVRRITAKYIRKVNKTD